MYKAIMTKYLGPTNNLGSRVKADDGDGNTLTMGIDHSINSDAMHRMVAEGLRDKMGWHGQLEGGATKDGFAWVFTS